MTEPQIIRIPIIPLGIVNSHLIIGKDGCILVDTGLPGSKSKIEKVLTRHGLSFKDIKLIVTTPMLIMQGARMQCVNYLRRQL